MVRGADGPIGRSAKAWALVIGGMIVVGIVNVILGWHWFFPDEMDKNWEPPDAGAAAAASAPDGAAGPPPAPAPAVGQGQGQGQGHGAGR